MITEYPPYRDYVKYLKGKGYIEEKLNLTENSTNFISKHKNNEIFKIQCPSNPSLILILPNVDNLLIMKDYGFALKIMDKEGKEISGDTEIEIIVKRKGGLNILISNILYYNIRIGGYTLYHPIKGFELKSYDRIIFKLMNYDIEKIDIEKCKICANMDLFTKIHEEKKVINPLEQEKIASETPKITKNIIENKPFGTKLMDYWYKMLR